MVNAEWRAPAVSPTMSEHPSGVMTEPLGKSRSAATEAAPSGSIRISAAGAGSAPPMRSKPKFPA
jgi:hypothetical protein